MVSKLTPPPTDIITAHHAAGKKTYILPLARPSVTTLLPLFPHLNYHTDVFELRVDLLCDPAAAPGAPPSCSFLKSQLLLLQQATHLPIMFTIRTLSQGGKWPDAAHEAALEAMLMAVREGCAYVDVEIEWPQEMIDVIVREKGGSKIVGSFHDWTGNIPWGSEVLREKFERADSFGGEFVLFFCPPFFVCVCVCFVFCWWGRRAEVVGGGAESGRGRGNWK